MTSVYKKTESVVTREIAGETMLIPITGNLADMQNMFALDDVSAFIWNMLDGSKGMDDIVSGVTVEYEVTEVKAEEDAKAFLQELSEAGLVELA
jgi:hypothetical protein